jgi:uncharacterized pyridoxamine 5'-phosphate oxidase family protein
VVDVSTPVTSLDERYSSSEATAFSWSETQRELEKAEIFWLTTVRDDGRPHVTPLVAVWWNGALHFTTGDKEQKYANLRSNSHVALTTGCNDWREGVDIVVEGDARQGADQRELEDRCVPGEVGRRQLGIRGARRQVFSSRGIRSTTLFRSPPHRLRVRQGNVRPHRSSV